MFMGSKKIVAGILAVVFSAFADVNPTSSAGSSGIVDFYFTTPSSNNEVPKVYLDIAKINTEVNAVMGYFPRSIQTQECMGGNKNVCPRDAAQCNANTEVPSCPTGGILNTDRDMCQSEPTFKCGAGYVFDRTIDRCVRDVSCPDGGLFNANTDRCEKLSDPYCPEGYVIEDSSSVCWKNVDCGVDGYFNSTKDRCEKPLNVGCSDPEYLYNPTTFRCERAPKCAVGAYSSTYNKCIVDYVEKCDAVNGYVLNSTTKKCERVPQCQAGTSYNTLTNRCEGVSACSAPAVWDAVAGKCKSGGTSTYASVAVFSSCQLNMLSVDRTVNNILVVTAPLTSYFDYQFDINCRAYDTLYRYYLEVGTTKRYGQSGVGAIFDISNVSQKVYSCPSGGTLSGTTCTVNTTSYIDGTCAAGLSPDPSTGKCVANPTCPIAAGFGASTYDSNTDKCWSDILKDCSANAGFVYDSASAKCIGGPDCVNGTLDANIDMCFQNACPSGYSFDATRKACEADPICSSGTYHTGYDKCLLNYTPGCDEVSGYEYDSARSQCERVPQCQAGTSYNTLTNRCEGVSACSAPAVWDAVAGKCKSGGTSIYTATENKTCHILKYDDTMNAYSCGYSDGGDIHEERPYLNVVAGTYGCDDDYCSSISVAEGDIVAGTSGVVAGVSVVVDATCNMSSPVSARNNYGRALGCEDIHSAWSILSVAQVKANPITYSCPSGGTLSGTTCTVNTTNYTNGTCAAGLSPDPSTGKCVANPTCPTSAGWSATFDGGVDKCKTAYLKNCPAGMIYDVASNMCSKIADCNNSKATLNTSIDKCAMAVGECGNWQFDTSINACYSAPACEQGVFNYLKNRCEAVIAQECGSYAYDTNASKCTLGVTCPVDSAFEEKASVAFSSELDKCVSLTKHTCLVNYTYNGLPVVKCEAIPICVRGVYQPQLDSCFLNNYTCPIGNYECRVTTGVEAWCSPYDCVDDYCRLALCPSLEMAQDGASNPSACAEIVCDASKPYNGYCGKEDCPAGYGIFKENGKCYKGVCPAGAIEQPDGSCQMLQCPAGTTEVDGKCLVNQ